MDGPKGLFHDSYAPYSMYRVAPCGDVSVIRVVGSKQLMKQFEPEITRDRPVTRSQPTTIAADHC